MIDEKYFELAKEYARTNTLKFPLFKIVELAEWAEKLGVPALKSAQSRMLVTIKRVPIGEEHTATLLSMADVDEALAALPKKEAS